MISALTEFDSSIKPCNRSLPQRLPHFKKSFNSPEDGCNCNCCTVSLQLCVVQMTSSFRLLAQTIYPIGRKIPKSNEISFWSKKTNQKFQFSGKYQNQIKYQKRQVMKKFKDLTKFKDFHCHNLSFIVGKFNSKINFM